MPPKKRTSPDSEDVDARPTKTQKTAKGKKAAAKPAMPLDEFKEKARPIHVHITHTPPSINAKEPTKAEDAPATTEEETDITANPTSESAPIDTGLISNLTLLPSSFATGSYGWKGSKKIVVELQNSEDGPNGREKVQVMLTINATVVGSKQSGSGKGDEEDVEEDGKEEEEAQKNED